MTLTNEQALQIIDQALNVGTKAGAYVLKEATIISAALATIRQTLNIPEAVQAELVQS